MTYFFRRISAREIGCKPAHISRFLYSCHGAEFSRDTASNNSAREKNGRYIRDTLLAKFTPARLMHHLAVQILSKNRQKTRIRILDLKLEATELRKKIN